MTGLLGAILSLALLDAPSSAAPAPAAERVIYRCSAHIGNVGSGIGGLSLEKSFFEDGAVAGLDVSWEDQVAPFVHPHVAGGHAMATFRWPAESGTPPGRPFSWWDGTVRISLFGPGTDGRYRPRRRERWRQVVVDRDGSVLIHGQGVERSLYLRGPGAHLMTEFQELSSPGHLIISVGGLLAWGAATGRVSVYELLVTRTRPRPDSAPSLPAGRRRIVASYDIDVAALARVVAAVREATERWDATLTDFRRDCERGSEDGNIVVT